MRRRWIPVRRILILGPDLRIDVEGPLIGKHELAIDDFYARAERRAARRGADREKQLTAGLEDVLERVTRSGNPRPLAHESHHGPTGVACELDSRREI